MGSQHHAENARAGREARAAVVREARARDPLAVDAALRRYLAAEQYVREHPHDGTQDEVQDKGKDRGKA